MARSANLPWTNASIAGILARHACPARCGARRRAKPPSLGSAPCLPLDTGKLLPRSLRPRQPASRRHPAVKSADPGQPPKSSAAAFNAPDLRGFRPPSTRKRAVVEFLDFLGERGGGLGEREQLPVPQRRQRTRQPEHNEPLCRDQHQDEAGSIGGVPASFDLFGGTSPKTSLAERTKAARMAR